MKKETQRFILAGILCSLFCIGIFVWSTFSILHQGVLASSALSDIYINAVNFQMQLHFRSIIDLKLEQVKGIVNSTPPDTVKEYGDVMRSRLAAGALLQNFTYLALYDTEGNADIITGEDVFAENSLTREAFLRELNAGEGHVASATTASGRRLLLMGVSVGYPVSEGYPMRNGGTCTALVAGLPLEYIQRTLAMDLNTSLLYSQIIRRDGSFVLRSSSVTEDNCYAWIRNHGSFQEKTAQEILTSLKQDIAEKKEHSLFMTMNEERLYVHCSPLPHSQWYLVTVMPQGSFDDIISDLWTQRIYTAVGAGLLLPLPILALLFF